VAATATGTVGLFAAAGNVVAGVATFAAMGGATGVLLHAANKMVAPITAPRARRFLTLIPILLKK